MAGILPLYIVLYQVYFIKRVDYLFHSPQYSKLKTGAPLPNMECVVLWFADVNIGLNELLLEKVYVRNCYANYIWYKKDT